MTAAQLTQDVLDKARRLGVRVHFDVGPFQAYYMAIFRTLHTQAIRDYGIVNAPDSSFSIHETPEVAYFVALHELGHAATLPPEAGDPFSTYNAQRTEEVVLRQEADAWKWALDHTIIPVTAEMREMARAALEHYRKTSNFFTQAFPPEQWRRTVNELNELAVAA